MKRSAVEDERCIWKNGHLFLLYADVNKPATANASGKVDREGGIDETGTFQEALDLNGQRAASGILLPIEVKTASENPADSAGGDLCTVRSRKGKVLKWYHGRIDTSGSACGTSLVALSSPDVSSGNDGGDAGGIRFLKVGFVSVSRG